MNLGTLFVRLNADSKDLLSGFSKGSAAVEKFARETKKLANDVAQVSGTMLALGAGALALAATVDGPTAKSMDGLKKSTQLLAIQVADILRPAVAALTEGFKDAANWIAGLDPHLKQQLATWAKYVAIIAVVSKGVAVVAGLISGLAGAFSAVTGVLAAIGSGPIIALVVGIAAVAAAIAALHYAFRTNFAGIADGWKTLVDWLSATGAAAFKGLSDFGLRFADGFLANLRDLADGMAHFFDLIGSGENRKKALNIYQSLESARQGLLKNGYAGVVADAMKLGKAAGGAFLDEWKRIMADLGISDLVGKLTSGNGGKARGPAGAARPQGDISGMGFAADESMRNRELMAAAAERAKSERDFAAANYAAQAELVAGTTQWMQAQAELAIATKTNAKRITAQMSGSRAGLTSAQAVAFGVSTRKQDEQERRGNMSPKQMHEEDSAAAARKWSAVGSIALQGITAAMGEVGTLVQSAASAIQSGGGVWGAVIAVIMEVVKKTESAMKFVGVAMEFVKQLAAMVEPLVKPIFDALTGVLGAIMNAVGPLFDALKPFAELVVQSIGNLMGVFVQIGNLVQALSPIIEFVGELMKAMDTFLAPLLDILAGVLKVFATVILGILIGLNELAGAFGDQKGKAEAARLKAIVDKMWAPGADARAAADNDAAGAAMANAAAQNAAAEAAQKVAQAFTNVPEGYKIALRRFGAMGNDPSLYDSQQGIWAPQSNAPPPPPAPRGSSSGGDSGTPDEAPNADAAYYRAYSDAVAAGATYADADAAGQAARAAWVAKHGGGSQKSGGPSKSTGTGSGIKTAGTSSSDSYSSALPTPGMGGGGESLVIMGDVIIYAAEGDTLESLMREAKKKALQRRGQSRGNPYDP